MSGAVVTPMIGEYIQSIKRKTRNLLPITRSCLDGSTAATTHFVDLAECGTGDVVAMAVDADPA